jgi:hypothetical protein
VRLALIGHIAVELNDLALAPDESDALSFAGVQSDSADL